SWCAHCRRLRSFPTRRSSVLTDGRLLQPVARLRDGVIDDVVDAARDGTHVHDGCLHAAGCGDDGLIPPLGGEGVSLVTLVPQGRSEEHTSELQSRENLVCRLL